MISKLIIDYEKCVGCESCEQACSAKNTGIVNPALSRIGVVKRQLGTENIPIVCQQCESAPCMAICPVKAISLDEELGRIIVDYDICIGCRMCVAICPFGCMLFDEENRKVFKCDLCDGDPICVRFCEHQAIQYLNAAQQSTLKQAAIAEKVSGIMHRIASAMANAK
jgi:carbon-monoxide dehydrogenase iron sulfur subunit